MIDVVTETPELKKPVPTMTIILVLVVAGMGYLVGAAQTKLSMQDRYFEEKVKEIYKHIEDQHGFAIDEVEGVRADMDKEDMHLHDAINAVEGKITRKHNQQQTGVDHNAAEIKNLKRKGSD